MELEELARKHALKNAVEYGGECDPGAVIGKLMAETEEEPGKVQEVAGKVCGEVNSMSLEEQQQALEKYEFEREEHEHDPLPDLKNAEEGNVVVRFAPNPNSPPHIGHARGMVINGELRDKYSGKLILRFDDTDPRKKRPLKDESRDAYEMYRQDYEWLGYAPDEVRYSSKNFDTYIDYAEELIREGKAYVCFCSREEGRRHRSEGKACPHRGNSKELNLAHWQAMKTGEEFEGFQGSPLEPGDRISEGEATLKVKTDLSHKNPAVRDFVAFRIIENPGHPLTGNEYRVWPLLDFAGAVEDHEMGTTHIVRGKDLRASTKRQEYIYRYFDWDYPEVRYWGNVKISGFNAPVSGSELAEMIEDGELEGWDDPRAPTLRALKKRGFQPAAIQEFFIEMGVNENDIEASIDTLESKNRDFVEEKDRYFFIADPVKIEIEGVPGDLEPELPFHPDHPERGVREIDLETEDGSATVYVDRSDLEDGFLRLKGLCNVEIEGRTATYVEGDHTEAVERDAPIIHWLPANAGEAEVVMPDNSRIEGRIEENSVEEGEVVQFERFGFARKDSESTFYFAHE